MIGALRDRLGRHPSVPPPDERDPEPGDGSAHPEVEFAAYAEDCRIFGFWRHGAERLSDALNDHDEYVLHDVLVAALDDGRGTELRELVVHRDELIAVRAAGPRGNAARRSRVRPSPITLKAGPYTVYGYVHGPPGSDPLIQIRRRKLMVPLTEAWIEYQVGATQHRARLGVVVINHGAMDWVRLSKDAEVRLAELPVEIAIDPRAKDMTGHIMWQG